MQIGLEVTRLAGRSARRRRHVVFRRNDVLLVPRIRPITPVRSVVRHQHRHRQSRRLPETIDFFFFQNLIKVELRNKISIG